MDLEGVEQAMRVAYGKAAHRCLTNDAQMAKAGASSLRTLLEGVRHHNDNGHRLPTLLITGPVSDGFWVRVLTVMAHASWARRLGMPIALAYRSPHDPYLDRGDLTRDGWSQYFEPVLPLANLSAARGVGGSFVVAVNGREARAALSMSHAEVASSNRLLVRSASAQGP